MSDTNEKNKQIVIVKLYNGEMIIGKHDLSFSMMDGQLLNQSDISKIEDPRILIIAPTFNMDKFKVLFAPIFELFKVKRLEESIDIQNKQIMFFIWEKEMDKDLINSYLYEISGIAIPSSSETNNINNNNCSISLT